MISITGLVLRGRIANSFERHCTRLQVEAQLLMSKNVAQERGAGSWFCVIWYLCDFQYFRGPDPAVKGYRYIGAWKWVHYE